MRLLQLRQVGFEPSLPVDGWELSRLSHLHVDDWRVLPGNEEPFFLTNLVRLPPLTHVCSRVSNAWKMHEFDHNPVQSIYWLGLRPVAAQLEFVAADDARDGVLQELQVLASHYTSLNHIALAFNNGIAGSIVLRTLLDELPGALAVLDVAAGPWSYLTGHMLCAGLQAGGQGVRGLRVLRLPRVAGLRVAQTDEVGRAEAFLREAARMAEERKVAVEWV